jgi:hypothetical protein
MLKRILARWSTRARPEAHPEPRPASAVELPWREGTTYPIPDWEAHAANEPGDAGELDAFWTAAAEAWLEQLGRAFGAEFKVSRSPGFLLLSSLPARRCDLVLGYCERTRKAILRNLEGIAAPSDHGKHVLVVVDDADQYYDYVANYYPERGEFAYSGGMFVHHGYGHFVLIAKDLDAMEPTIAHELTHALVAHLPIPAWLNEGLAVNTEQLLVPHLAHPSNALYTPLEMAEKHARYWNADSIQSYWCGQSFVRPDDGNALSYDLAQKMVALAARDYPRFRAFCLAARYDDSGDAASREHYGAPIDHLLECVLEPGPWAIEPAKWRGEIERGAFD